MPKKEVEKNTKTKKVNTVKKAPAKKSVGTKKSEIKVVNNNTVVTKKVEVKKDETSNNVKIEKKEGRFSKLVDKIVSNTPFAISLCVIVILVALLILTLCVKRIPRTSDGKDLLATLNGKEITADELYISLKDTYGTNELIKLIDTYITDKEVKITKDDKAYVQEVVDYYKQYAEYYKTDLITFLANYVGLTDITSEDEFYDYVLDDYKKTLAIVKFIGDNAKEDELKEYYKNNYSDKLTARHILIQVDADAEDKDAADKEAYNKAVELINILNSTDKDKLEEKFIELAKDNSDDTGTYSDGGLVKDFAKADVENEFYEAASKLKNGKYTAEPVKTTYGYHIIYKVSSTPVEKYKDIKDDVKKAYAESLLSSDTTLRITKWDELRKQYKLSIKDDVMKEAYKETIKTSLNKDTTTTTTEDTNTTTTEDTNTKTEN